MKRKLHFLSLKISLGVGACVLVLLALISLVRGVVPETLLVLLGSVAAGTATYFAVRRLVATRLDLARRTLKQIRKRQFENLEAVRVPKGDELSALVWQVYQTGLALRREIDELRKVENYRREFLGNVSHELKTPTFAIQGFAETLLDGALDDKEVNRQFLEKIRRNAHRLDTLVNDLIELSRIETGELSMSIDAFDLSALMEEVVESLEVIASGSGVTLSVDVPPGFPAVEGDRERIRQVLANLIDNGIKYTDRGGRVAVTARRLGTDRVRIEVRDTGIGISPGEINRLTERFYRVDRSRSREAGGTGLGLAIVKHILEAHGQKLAIESTPGEGSTFSFTMKLAVP